MEIFPGNEKQIKITDDDHFLLHNSLQTGDRKTNKPFYNFSRRHKVVYINCFKIEDRLWWKFKPQQ